MTRGDKSERLAIRLTPEEQAMLGDLAAARSAAHADVVRSLIRAEYERTFPMKHAGAEIVATPRAILKDVMGPVHYTLGNIAERADVPPRVVRALLERLARRGAVERVDPRPKDQDTWEAIKPQDEVFRIAESVGIELDSLMELNALSFELRAVDGEEVHLAALGPSTRRALADIRALLQRTVKKIADSHLSSTVALGELVSELGSEIARATLRNADVYSAADTKIRLKRIVIDEV